MVKFRLPLLLINLLLLSSSFLWAQNRKIQDYLLSTPVNQDVALLQIRNQSSKLKALSLGINQDFKIDSTLTSLSEKKLLIECRQKGNQQEVPHLTLWIDGQRFALPKISKSYGDHHDENPMIWIDKEFSQAPEYEMLQAVKKIHGIAPMRIEAKDFPTHLSVVAKAPLIISSLSALLSLSADQKQTLKAAVYAGATLLIAVGDPTNKEDMLVADEATPHQNPLKYALKGFSGVTLGDINPPEDGYSVKIPSYRELIVDEQSMALVVMEKELNALGESAYPKPLLTENPLGLGRVRILGVRLNQLLSSQLYKVAFSLNSPNEWERDLLSKTESKKEKDKEALLPIPAYQKIPRPGFEQLSSWLDDRFEPLNATEHLFQFEIIYIALIAFLLFMLTKRSVLYLGIAFACVLLIAFTNMPINQRLQTHKAKLLYFPMEEGALVLGMMDLSFFYQGEQFKEIKRLPTEEALRLSQISLLETQNQGLCLIHELEQKQAQGLSSLDKDQSFDQGIAFHDQGLDEAKIIYREEDEQETIETNEYYHTSWFLKGQLGSRQRIKFIALVSHIPNEKEGEIFITSQGPWKGQAFKALDYPDSNDFLTPAFLNHTEAWLVSPGKKSNFQPLILK